MGSSAPGTLRSWCAALLAASLLTCSDSAGPPPAVTRVDVTGVPVLFLGRSGSYAATAYDQNGGMLTGRRFTWRSTDTSVVTVDKVGLVTAVGLGQALVQATADGVTGSGPVAVQLAHVARVVLSAAVDSVLLGDSVRLHVALLDSAALPVLGRSVQWRSSDTTRAVVTDSGVVIARTVGSLAITATSDGVTSGTFVDVQYPVVSIALPESVTIGLFQVVQLIPDLRSGNGVHLAGRTVTWASGDTTVLRVSVEGILTPRRVGTALVSAAISGASDTTLVRVAPTAVRNVVLQPGGFSMTVGDTSGIVQATPLDSFGNVASGNSVSWSSSDTTIARPLNLIGVTDRIRIVAVGLGTARITATSGGKTVDAPVVVGLPPARFVFEPESLVVYIGSARGLPGTVRDSLGTVLTLGYLIHYTVVDTAIAIVDTTGFPAVVRGRAAGQTAVIGRTDGGFLDTASIRVPPNTSIRLDWRSSVVELGNYASSIVPLVLTDSSGNPLPASVAVVISSSDTAVVASSPTAITASDSAPILVLARGPGFARLVAAGNSVFATLSVQVDDRPATSIAISPRPRLLTAGDTVRLGATGSSNDGTTYPYPVAWSSSDPTRASISDSGLVSALSGGVVTIEARRGVLFDTVSLTIQSSSRPTVAAVTPAPLTPGTVAVVRGTGFDPDPAANAVTVDGVPATVTAAADTELAFILADAQSYPCTPTHAAHVTITSGESVVSADAPLAVAVQRSLQPGEYFAVPAGETRCNELAQTGGNYFVIVGNPTPSALATIPIELRGIGPAPPQAILQSAGPVQAARSSFVIDRDSLRRAAVIHRRMLEYDRAFVRRAGPPALAWRTAPRPVAPQLSVGTMVGNQAAIRIPQIDYPDFCSRYYTITARLVYSGTHVLVFEDAAAPLARTMDDSYRALGMEFDAVMWPKLRAAFGNPLSLDSLLDANGRIAMVFSHIVNSFGPSGFVVSCDFYPETIAPASNTGEILYAIAPTAPGTGFGALTKDVWRWLIRSVVMHEAKHLVSYSEHLSRGAPLEETWLEEGSAVVAEELWSRGVYGTTWKGNASYRQTLYCDVRPTFTECAGRPYSMFNGFAFLYDYAQYDRTHSPLGPVSFDDATYYGSSWSLLRWAVDQYAGTEEGFLSALTQEPSLTGVANLSARTGHPFPEMARDWFAAVLSDDAYAPNRPQLNFPSWNLRDEFSGMHDDFPGEFSWTFPLSGYYFLFGDFLTEGGGPIRGGSSSLFNLSGSQLGTQLLEVRRTGGGLPAPETTLQILRVQ
jgi:uncharacterized protein YjdB